MPTISSRSCLRALLAKEKHLHIGEYVRCSADVSVSDKNRGDGVLRVACFESITQQLASKCQCLCGQADSFRRSALSQPDTGQQHHISRETGVTGVEKGVVGEISKGRTASQHLFSLVSKT